MIKKTGTHTSDRVDVGTDVKHVKSHGAAKQLPSMGAVLHNGQPSSLGGSGLKTGHKGNNC